MPKDNISPSVPVIMEWTVAAKERERPLALVLPGPSHVERQQVLRQYLDGIGRNFPGIVIDASEPLATAWVRTGISENFLQRTAAMRLPHLGKEHVAEWYHKRADDPWNLLWGLIGVEDFLVDEPLRGMLDQPFYLVHDVHRALWEARFLAREDPTLASVDVFVEALIPWISGLPLTEVHRQALDRIGITRTVSPTERLDVLCALYALAYQSGLIERVVLVYDDLEEALHPQQRPVLRQLRDFLVCLKRWDRLGSPIGLLIGFTGARADLQLLSKYCTPLAAEVSTGLDWTRKSVA